MSKIQNPLPIDLVLADQLFPVMKSASRHLESIPQLYQELDNFFWRNFSELFTGRVSAPPGDRVLLTLLNLRHTAGAGRLAKSLHWLEHNNERVSTATDTLGIILNRR